MSMPPIKATPKIPVAPHPIELLDVQVTQLFFVLNTGNESDISINGHDVNLLIRQDPIESNSGSLIVAARAMYGLPIDMHGSDHLNSDSFPCSFMVELNGKFRVPLSMSITILQRFQKNGALLILSPFLREHVYSLTGRAGIKPVTIPLMQVPIFKMAEEPSDGEPDVEAVSSQSKPPSSE